MKRGDPQPHSRLNLARSSTPSVFCRLFVLLTLLLLLATPGLSAAQSRQQHVLLINSYQQGMTWVEDIERAVREELRPETGEVTLQIENMDTKQHYSPAYLDSLARHYAEKYRDVTFDLILATDNHAYDFLLANRDSLFPGVPVAFSGVNDFRDGQLDGKTGFTGVAEIFDARGTVELALELFPHTREIYIVNDYLKTGRAWEREIRRQLSGLDGEVRITYSDNLSLDEQQQRIAQLPDDALVLLGVYFSGRDGRHTTYEQIGEALAMASRVPVFCLLEFNVGSHIIGGNVISGYYQGQMMSRLGKRILRGEPADAIAVIKQGANRFIFDYNALERWQLAPARLPRDAIVINEPWSLYKAYRTQIGMGVLFVLILLIIIVILVFNIRSRVVAQTRLREQERRFEGIFNQTFQFIGLLSPSGIVLDANKSALLSCGADLEAIRGMPFCDTPWFSHSEAERMKLREAINSAADGHFVRFETTHYTRDGQLAHMDFSLNPVFDEQGKVSLLIPEGRDISELTKALAALKASRDRLETLVADQKFVLENINDFIYRHDLKGDFLYVSPSIKRITGYDPQEWGGNYADTLTPSPLNEPVKAYTEEALSTGIAHDPYEIEIWHKNGQPIRLEISERPYSEAGEVVGMVGVARDVTDRAAAEKAVRDLSLFQQTIIENVDVWLAVYDEQGAIAIWNKTAERISGYSCDEVHSRRHIMTLLYPDTAYREEVMAEVLPAAAGDQVLENFHTHIVCKDGTQRSMVWNTRALRDTGGRQGSITIGLDVTERELAAREAMQLRNYLQNVVDSLPSILVAVDRECRIVQMNNAATRAVGVAVDALLGQSLASAFPQLSSEIDNIRRAIATGRPSTTPKRLRSTDTGELYEDISIYPLVGQFGGAVIRVDDVTERMRIEALMIQSEKMLSVGGLAAGMAHEINNPLAGIIQNTQVMKNRLDLSLAVNQEAAQSCQLSLDGLQLYLQQRGIHQMMENIARSGLRAARIVENMLSFSRKSSVDYNPQDLGALIDATIELASNDYDLKKKYDFRKIEIRRDYAADMPRVACESGQIQQVILNLLKNGAQAMSQADPAIERPCFEIHLTKRDELAQIDIQDNGPGMTPEVLKRVFEPFFTTKQVGVGTGLGLSVSYFIITENHMGHLKVRSSPGRGACFSIQLPINRPSVQRG